MTWVFSAEITYQDRNGSVGEVLAWNGAATQTVSGEGTQPDGTRVFTLEETLAPAPPEEIWRQPHSFPDAFAGDQVFLNGNPLSNRVEGSGAAALSRAVMRQPR